MSIDPRSFPASLADIRRAAEYLAPVAVRTPLLESSYLNDIAGRRVLIKAEVLQRTGSSQAVLWRLQRRLMRIVSMAMR